MTDTENIIEFPKGVIAELDVIAAQQRRRGVIQTVDGTPVQVVRITHPKTKRQRRPDGKYGWETRGSNVNLFFIQYRGEYKAGTRILTDVDPTNRQAFNRN